MCSVDAETALYTELWRACAGPLVTVPRERELVYYFPQGHIEQVGFRFLTQKIRNYIFYFFFIFYLSSYSSLFLLVPFSFSL